MTAPSTMIDRFVFLLAVLIASGTIVQAAIRDSFESNSPTFRLVERDCEMLIGKHERGIDHSHSGQVSEHLRLRCGQGTKIYFAQAIEPAYVIEEFAASLWVKSDRPGIQIIARVKLPRTKDLDTGGALRTLVYGSTYRDVGAWQRLKVNNLLKTLKRDEKVKRAKFGPHVDIREAYVDLIVLNVYAGQGNVNVWIDDLELDHHVSAVNVQRRESEPVAEEQTSSLLTKAYATPRFAGTTGNRFQLNGTHFQVDGKPLFLRSIEHRGESLEWLKQLGFNCAHLSKPATEHQLEEAARIGLWLVAPPPDGATEHEYWRHSQIVAWNLDGAQTRHDPPDLGQLARQMRKLGGNITRPIVVTSSNQSAGTPSIADIFLLEEHSMGTAMTFRQHRHWMIGRIRSLSTGVHAWSAVATQLTAREIQQNVNVELDQIRLAAFNAVTCGCRGLVFRSTSRLDGRDTASRMRAQTLTLINLELTALDPWLAGGTRGGELSASDRQVIIQPIRTERSQLFIAMRHTSHQQFVCNLTNSNPVSFQSDSTSNSSTAYRIATLEGIDQLKHARRVSDSKISLDEVSPVSMVVTTQDLLVVAHLKRHDHQNARRTAVALHELAIHSLQQVAKTCDQLHHFALAEDSRRLLRGAHAHLQRSEDALHTARFIDANSASRQCLVLLSDLKEANWNLATKNIAFPSDSPLTRCFDTLPKFWAERTSAR